MGTAGVEVGVGMGRKGLQATEGCTRGQDCRLVWHRTALSQATVRIGDDKEHSKIKSLCSVAFDLVFCRLSCVAL